MVKIMMVRSQNKELITFLENIQVIKIRKDTDESVKIVFEYVEGSKTMGQYHSYQVALKVLDMIQEAYADAKLNEILLPDVCKSASESQRGKDNTSIAKTIRKDFMKKMIFQMPEDSEVEV